MSRTQLQFVPFQLIRIFFWSMKMGIKSRYYERKNLRKHIAFSIMTELGVKAFIACLNNDNANKDAVIALIDWLQDDSENIVTKIEKIVLDERKVKRNLSIK